MESGQVDDRVLFFITRGWQVESIRERVFLDALFLRNPAARVAFVATTPHLPLPELLQRYVHRGYSLHGVHVPVDRLLTTGWWLTDENRLWLEQQIHAGETVPYFYTHITDYLRFYLLHRFGALYTDSDSIFMQSAPTGEFVGLDFENGPALECPAWFFDPPGRLYAAPGVLRLYQSSEVASGVMVAAFDPRNYEPSCFNCVGPKALGESLQAASASLKGIQLLPQHALYPLSYRNAHWLLEADGFASSALFLAHLRRTSVAVHLFGGMTSSREIEPGSVVQLLASSDTLTALSPELVCSIGGSRTLVAKNHTLALDKASLVFVRDCPPLEDGAFVDVHVDFGALLSRPGTSRQHVRFGPASSLASINRGLAALEFTTSAASNTRHDTDRLFVSVVAPSGRPLREANITVLLFNRLVTVLVHTSGRAPMIQSLYDSVQMWFPGTTVLASDGSQAAGQTASPLGDCMSWVTVPPGAGASLARNTLVMAATTPFVLVIDDDWKLGPLSHLDVLLEVLHTSGFDIAGAGSPQDAAGLINSREFDRAEGRHMQQPSRGHERVEGCLRTDTTPQVFMARRSALLRSAWDLDLKTGEHEDFSVRAKAAGLRALSCDYVQVMQHHGT